MNETDSMLDQLGGVESSVPPLPGCYQDEAMRARMIRKWSAISRTDLRESSRILALETIRV
jgi:hypothetical protein